MTKFLNNEIKGPQEVSLETLKGLFPSFEKADEETQKKSNKFILISNGKTEDGVEWQVAYQDVPSPHNWFYHIFLFGIDGTLLTALPSRIVNPFPPVFEKKFGIDYLDWLDIQATIAKWLASNGYKAFNIDFSTEGKVVYLTKENPDKIVKMIEKGESYNIIAMPAEEYMNKVREWQEAQKANKKLIVTPQEASAEKVKNIITP